MEHALAQTEQTWREVADSPLLDDLEALRQGVVRQLIFSAAHPQVLRIMNHEGAIDSPRVRFVMDASSTRCAQGLNAFSLGSSRPDGYGPYPTQRFTS
jgi:hypothetical protein